MDKIILQGGGEHARVVLDCLLSLGHDVKALFDPKYNDELFGVKQLGEYDPAFEPGAKAIAAIGNNALRKRVVAGTKHDFTSCIHASAILSSRSNYGSGCMILHGAIVQVGTKIGSHVIINTGAKVDHDCVIENYVHVAPGATLCGTVNVGEGTLVGAGAVILPGRKIGKWSVIGAGAVVTTDVLDNTVVVGNPAKVINKFQRE